jgi:riboflavin synthase
VFTGLVETTGILAERAARGPGARLVVRARLAGEALALGESILVDGACLSVTDVLPDGFAVDATVETLSRTTLGELGLGGKVNLERAMRAGDRLGGHIVTGHVDAVGSLTARKSAGDAVAMTFAFPARLARYVAEKGSITVGGVSLTVNAVRSSPACSFDVMLIPITLSTTHLGDLQPGYLVNLEVDLVARYVTAWLDAGGVPATAGR